MSDTIFTKVSYTPKILQYAKYYRTYSNIVSFLTVTGEYLLAMKMMSGRKYKYDRSDIIGILWEQEKAGDPLSLGRIQKAVDDLYGSYDVLSDEIKQFVENVLSKGNYEEMYAVVRKAEADNKANLIEYQEIKPDVINEDNVGDIIEALKRRKENQNDF